MVKQVHSYLGEVIVYSGGALTNVALAVRMGSEFARLAKALVIMGGYIDVNLLQTSGPIHQANINSDINLIADPAATKIALTADFPDITVVGNGANQIYPTPEYLDEIYEVKNAYTELIHKYYGTTMPFWDETAMFAALDPGNILNSTTCEL
ncbi:putative inosine-uridine preferring nucleoside hydrolase [Fusarium bulbicola]|nr:putative inosine-uridine preferring nucleoside hydrolase [Fusarium bulbicola]